MGYSSMIDSKLALTYKQLKDLAEEVVFVTNEVGEFDFGSSEPSVQASPDRTVKAIRLNEKKEKGVRKMELLFKTAELPLVSKFDQVKVNGKLWAVGPVIHQRKYATLLNLVLGG